MAWMETDYSEHTHFRWKIKWQLGHLGAQGIMGGKTSTKRNAKFAGRREVIDAKHKSPIG